MIVTAYRLINSLFGVYYFLILARIFLSWIPVNQYNYYVRKLYKITDPYLNIFRKIIPPVGMIDFSPIIAIIALDLVKRILFQILSLLV